MAEPEVLFEVRGRLGLITLNRPHALNALTWGMVKAMDGQLAAWAEDDAIDVVAIQGAGDKAFAAGGDIRWLYDNGQGGAAGERNFQFFADEYRLNRRIKRYPKPYVALMDGIVMGGGVGVSIHGSLRIATERTVFAMPETGIGLFPDVGGTFFLSRLFDGAGPWLGLTGDRIKGAATVDIGLCDRTVPSRDLEGLLNCLATGSIDPSLEASALDEAFLEHANAYASSADRQSFETQTAALCAAFAHETLEDVIAYLEESQTEWAAKARKTILSKSPTSTRIAFRQIREGAKLDFEDCMRLEYRLARYCMTHPDFYEGVRALIIDKDNTPVWSPGGLDQATDDFIAEAFANLGDEELDFDLLEHPEF